MGVTSKSVRLPVQKVQHWTGGGHRPRVLVRLLRQRLVPMCPGGILDRASSKAVLRTRGPGTSSPSARRRRYGLEPASARTSTVTDRGYAVTPHPAPDVTPRTSLRAEQRVCTPLSRGISPDHLER